MVLSIITPMFSICELLSEYIKLTLGIAKLACGCENLLALESVE